MIGLGSGIFWLWLVLLAAWFGHREPRAIVRAGGLGRSGVLGLSFVEVGPRARSGPVGLSSGPPDPVRSRAHPWHSGRAGPAIRPAAIR